MCFGFEHFKQLDFLNDKEVVLTCDDGPWPVNTPSVLKSLADECTKAVFFPIGKHATYHPEILKQVAAAGHSVGAHTWSHANLNSRPPRRSKKVSAPSSWRWAQPPRRFFAFRNCSTVRRRWPISGRATSRSSPATLTPLISRPRTRRKSSIRS